MGEGSRGKVQRMRACATRVRHALANVDTQNDAITGDLQLDRLTRKSVDLAFGGVRTRLRRCLQRQPESSVSCDKLLEHMRNQSGSVDWLVPRGGVKLRILLQLLFERTGQGDRDFTVSVRGSGPSRSFMWNSSRKFFEWGWGAISSFTA